MNRLQPPRSRSRNKRLLIIELAVTGAAALALAGHAVPAWSQTAPAAAAKPYALPAAPLEDALNSFSRRAGITLSFDPALTRGRSAPALSGSYTVPEGLAELLRGQPLRAVADADGSYVLQPAAAPAGQASAPEKTLPAVVINAKALPVAVTTAGYVATTSTSASKSERALLTTPQAVSVVTREQMDVQNVQSVAQALRYTSGINPEQRGTNTDSLEYLYARGFLIDQFWNGLRTPGAAGGFGYNVTSFDPYMLERIELLHGPSSVLYGQGSPGGSLNLVSKRATETPLHEIGVGTGNDGRAQAYFDIGGPLDPEGRLLYRVTADAFGTGTQTDHVREQRVAFAPTMTWRPSLDTSLTVFANYQLDPEAGIYNFVPAAGTVLPGQSISRNYDPGEPDFDSFRKMQASLGYELTHHLDDTWSFKQAYRYLHNSQTVKYVSYLGLSADGASITRTPYLNRGQVDAHTIDNQAIANFEAAGVHHQVTVGVDYQHIDFGHDFLGSLSATPSLNIAAPVYGQAVPYPDFMFATSGEQTVKQLGLYAQDQIDIGKWSILAGMREDWANEAFAPYKAGVAATSQFNRAFTSRLGAVYQFDDGVAPYASFSKSFQPQVGVGYSGQAFVPQTGEQYEAGVKLQPVGYNGFFTLAAFHLLQNNVTTSDPAHVGFSVQTGQVRSRGIEAEAHASLASNLQLIASYTYTNLLNTESNTANLDKVPVGIPRNTASAWVDYTQRGGAFDGLQFGGGVRYIGGSYGDTANSFETASATLLDLSLRYDLGRSVAGLRGWTATLNASNLLDRHYIASCSSGTCNWGQARLVLAGLKYQW